MVTALVIVSVVCVVFILTACFLGKELLKKFGFLGKLVEAGDKKILCTLYWPGSNKPGMRTIAVHGARPFTMLVGVKVGALGMEKVDPFGVVKSYPTGVAVFSTYLGRGPATFVFLSNVVHETGLEATTETSFIPSTTFPPHWYQKWGPLS